MTLRAEIRSTISAIPPCDTIETSHIAQALTWIDTGAPLFRISKPATPSPHLVSYFLLIDTDHLLLVDHINAQLWLPTGGHVDPDEHPLEAARREAMEELGITADFVHDSPTFLSISKTVGSPVKHTDISLWYVLHGDRHQNYRHDGSEFTALKWFHKDALPLERTEPHLARFCAKYFSQNL